MDQIFGRDRVDSVLGSVHQNTYQTQYRLSIAEKPDLFGLRRIAGGRQRRLRARVGARIIPCSILRKTSNKIIPKELAFGWETSGSVARLDEAAWPPFGS